MKQLSDRTVSLFLALAIFSAVGGLVAILIETGGDLELLTGLATTQTAIVNVTIQGLSAITISQSNIDFGTGTLTAGAAATPVNTTANAANANPSTFSEPGPLNVTNDGNTDLNITINGTLPAVWLGAGSTYEWAGNAGVESTSCPATNLTTARTPFSNTLTRVCANLTFSDGADQVSIHIFLNISNSATAVEHNDPAVLIRADACTGPC